MPENIEKCYSIYFFRCRLLVFGSSHL